jgi:hypothetical protein
MAYTTIKREKNGSKTKTSKSEELMNGFKDQLLMKITKINLMVFIMAQMVKPTSGINQKWDMTLKLEVSTPTE